MSQTDSKVSTLHLFYLYFKVRNVTRRIVSDIPAAEIIHSTSKLYLNLFLNFDIASRSNYFVSMITLRNAWIISNLSVMFSSSISQMSLILTFL